MDVTVNIVNAFVDDGKGGNPAGVVLDAQRYTYEQKQAIAAKVGLSETAFISPSTSADFKAGPLACFLFDRIKVRENDVMLIEQGHLMSPVSSSLINVRLSVSGGGIRKLMAGGKAKLIDSRTIRI